MAGKEPLVSEAVGRVLLTEVPEKGELPEKRKMSVFPTAHKRPSIAASFLGVLATRRLSMMKRMMPRIQDLRKESTGIQVHYEPTYRLEPKVTFSAAKAERILKDVVDERLEGLIYNAKATPSLIRYLCEEIKDRVKDLHYDRYKIVVNVTISQNTGQCILATSRCAWEPKYDTFASYSYSNKGIMCFASVYGVYTD
ncbi:dynein light chain Tctex-type 5-A-like [Gigantopelta aegis]|uniref:dynein light chain Tctex-type 5-A-like n=1 Tax=Gigantopelta aegis TaxID=1735272 RepID=UPI001B88CEC1|nr:dynein light chain Tctex-type 5-A-like [Gigantopelta aegis]